MSINAAQGRLRQMAKAQAGAAPGADRQIAPERNAMAHET
jgi:hypothetical protein